MKPMYKAMPGSPESTLSAGIQPADTMIQLLTATNLPPAPNLITIGTESDAEVVCYGGLSGTTLVDCVRGFGGTTAKAWPPETVVARCFTAYDHDTFVDNITELQPVAVTFEAAQWQQVQDVYQLEIPHDQHKRPSADFTHTILCKVGQEYRSGTWAAMGTTVAYLPETQAILLTSGTPYAGKINFQ